MNHLTTSISYLLVAIGLSACHAPDPKILLPTTRLNPGQSKAQVLEVMGTPRTIMSPGNGVEILKFQYKQPRGLMKTTVLTDYLVRLQDGRVEAYGTERELAPPKPIIVLGTDKTVNVNIKTDGNTNAITPIQPRLNIPTN